MERGDPARASASPNPASGGQLQGQQRPAPPATPQPSPPANADEIAQAVAEAQAELAAAAATEAFARDPYRLVLAGLSVSLGALAKIVRRMEDALGNTIVSLEHLEQSARHPLTPAERRSLMQEIRKEIREEIRTSQNETRRAAAAEFTREVWSRNLRTLGIVAVGVLVALVSVYFSGRQSLRAETEARIAAQRAEIEVAGQRLSIPPAQARVWLRWMQANENPAEAERRAVVQVDAAGRHMAAVPLWLDPQGVPEPAVKK